MTPGEFIEVFDMVAEAPGGIERLRELVLQLAVRGKLVSQDEGEEPPISILERNAKKKKCLVDQRKISKPKSLPRLSLDEVPFNVPETWQWIRLGDVALVVMGNSPPGSSYNEQSLGVPLINGPVEFSAGAFGLTICRKYTTKPNQMCTTGDMLICVRGATTGRTNIAAFDACIGRGVALVRAWDAQQYVNLYLWHVGKELLAAGKGTTFPSISYADLAGKPLPLPPIAEQRRIVAKVDELMGLIDRLEAVRRSREDVRTEGRDSALAALRNAATSEEVGTTWTRIAERMDDLFATPADLAPLREAVLQLAVRGRLVPQDEDEEPAGKLVAELEAGKERLLVKEIITKPRYPYGVSVEHEPFEIPETWQWLRLGDVGAIVGGGTPRSGESSFWSDEQDIPWLTPADMRRQPSRYITRGERDITSEGLRRSSAQMLPAGSVLFSSRAPIGHVGIAANPLSTNQGFKSCVPYISAMSDYLYVFLKYAGPGIDAQATGTTFKEVAGKELALVPVPIAPLAEQHRIVAKVDELMGLIDRLEQHLSAKEGIQRDFVVALSKRVEATIQ